MATRALAANLSLVETTCHHGLIAAANASSGPKPGNFAASFGLLLFVCLGGLLASGCRTTDRAEAAFPSVQVSGAAPAQIGDAVADIFRGEGYGLVHRDKSSLVFERQGSAWNNFAYGGWLDSQSVWIRANVSVIPLGDSAFQVECHPHLLISKGEALEEEIKTARPRLGAYQKMLDEVGRRLAGQPATAPPAPDTTGQK